MPDEPDGPDEPDEPALCCKGQCIVTSESLSYDKTGAECDTMKSMIVTRKVDGHGPALFLAALHTPHFTLQSGRPAFDSYHTCCTRILQA